MAEWTKEHTTRGMTFPAESLRKEEVQALLDACGTTAYGLRNRALTVVLWRAGLRIAEALALRPIDVDHEARAIRVLHGKGDKARTVGIDGRTVDTIETWEATRAGWDIPPRAPLFCTKKGGPIAQDYIRQMYPRLAREAGVDRRVHAHMFRHTFAVELARENVPLPFIQQLLGHASLATTSIYLASLSPEEALDAVRGRTW